MSNLCHDAACLSPVEVYVWSIKFLEMILSNEKNTSHCLYTTLPLPSPPLTQTHTQPECRDTPCHYYNDKLTRERLLERLLRVKLAGASR